MTHLDYNVCVSSGQKASTRVCEQMLLG